MLEIWRFCPLKLSIFLLISRQILSGHHNEGGGGEVQAEGSAGEYAGGDGRGVPSLIQGNFNIPYFDTNPSRNYKYFSCYICKILCLLSMFIKLSNPHPSPSLMMRLTFLGRFYNKYPSPYAEMDPCRSILVNTTTAYLF